MIKALASRVQRIKPSPTLTVAARAEELRASGKNIISLSVGEPDFDTPDFIKEAAIQAIEEGFTKYTAVDGIKNLKQAIVNKFFRENHLNYSLNQIVVSCGAKHSIFNLFESILEENDEVIIPAPYWVSYPDMVMLTDAKPVIVETDFSNQFKLTPALLEKHITPKTKIVVLNSPSNPTGIAYSKEELIALGMILAKHPEIIIVSDDIYEHTLWSKTPFCNILMACPELYNQCVIINGVSKAYAMTGWRIGFAAGPEVIINAMKKVQSQSTSNPTSISQIATIAALNGNQECIATMTAAFKERHDYVLAELQSMPGITCLPCDGTFYIFPSIENILKITPSIKDDIEFAEYLLNDAEVAVVPGSAFGAPNFIRISYATSLDNLKEAMKRMHLSINKLYSLAAS